MNMKMEEKYLKNIVTSGEAAMSAINQNRFGKFFFHLGPDRDEPIFRQVKKIKLQLKKVNLFYVQVFLMNMKEI